MKEKLNFREMLKDPMIIILAVLLIFLTVGNAFTGCTGNKKTIVLDAAYGGDNTGYAGIVNESDFTRNVVEALAKKLSSDRNFEVIITAQAGASVSVEERAVSIRNDNPDFVLSIHAGGSPDSTKSGTVVYADIPTHAAHETSLKVADKIASAFTNAGYEAETGYLYYKPYEDNSYELLTVPASDTQDYGYDTWELMRRVEFPVVICDQIYVTNQQDVDTWANAEGYEAAAEIYYQAIKAYYDFD